MTVTIEHLTPKPIEGDAVLWDGTYPQAQSIIAWLKTHDVDADYSATAAGVPPTITVSDQHDTTLYGDGYVVVTAEGDVYAIDDGDAATYFDVTEPAVLLAVDDIVKLLHPSYDEADMTGRVSSTYDDTGIQFAFVEWGEPRSMTAAYMATDLVKQ